MTPKAHTSTETAKPARAAPHISKGRVYKFVLQAATEKKLKDTPTVAIAGE
jgi:hypothetical protein